MRKGMELPIKSNTNVLTKTEKMAKALHRAVITASQNKYGVKVTPEEVYTIAVGEGFNRYLLNYYLQESSTDSSLSGFRTLGTDVIGSEVAVLKSGGFVSGSLNVQPQTETNEKGEKVTSGYFNNMQDGLEAAAGTIAFRKYLFLRDLKSFGVEPSTLTRQQMNFWLYLYFNPGPGFAKVQLRKYVQDGKLNDKNYITARPNEKVQNGRIGRDNAIIRAVMMETMYELGVLNLPGYSDSYR